MSDFDEDMLFTSQKDVSDKSQLVPPSLEGIRHLCENAIRLSIGRDQQASAERSIFAFWNSIRQMMEQVDLEVRSLLARMLGNHTNRHPEDVLANS